jgi:uncharacterized protein YegL
VEIPNSMPKAFATVDQFRPPVLDAKGDTPMGEAMRKALDLVSGRKEIYKQAGLDYFRPWIFLITDGSPTDRAGSWRPSRSNRKKAARAWCSMRWA